MSEASEHYRSNLQKTEINFKNCQAWFPWAVDPPKTWPPIPPRYFVKKENTLTLT